MFQKLEEKLEQTMTQLDQARRLERQEPEKMREGELVYVKDFRVLPHKKFKQKFYSQPFEVKKDC